jgi:hypothetical protein
MIIIPCLIFAAHSYCCCFESIFFFLDASLGQSKRLGQLQNRHGHLPKLRLRFLSLFKGALLPNFKEAVKWELMMTGSQAFQGRFASEFQRGSQVRARDDWSSGSSGSSGALCFWFSKRLLSVSLWSLEHVFYCICAFCWYIKDIITTRKMHRMERLKVFMLFRPEYFK